jgi:flagellar motor switch/type III secretory pathway protein FliN
MRSERGQARLPFPLRALPRGEIAARRRLLRGWPGAGPAVELPLLAELLAAGGAGLTLEGLDRVERPRAPCPAVAVAIADGQGPRAVLGVPLEPARRIVDLALGRPGRPGGAGLSTGEEGALLFALDRAAGDWIGAGGCRFEIRGLLADVEQGGALLPEGPLWRVTARLTVAGIEGPVWLWCAAPQTGVRGARTVPELLPAAVAGWPAEIGIEVGASRLPLAAIRDLAAGDLVVLDRLAHPDGATGGGAARLVSGAFARTIRWLDATRFELVSPAGGSHAMEARDEGEGPIRLASGPPEAGGAPDVVVRVEVARVRMTVGQATGLLPGRIVELDRPVGAEVVLCVGDGRIAAGVLVEHEGELAVEITEAP